MRNSARRGIASAALALTLIVPSFALAAGTDIPDNGASVLGRGGTSIGLLDTAYSLQFNPAGMSRVKGLDVRVDMRLVSPDITFKRADSEDGLSFDRVSNLAGVNAVPMAMAVYTPHSDGLLGRFSFGLGIWAPAGVRVYRYPNHRDARGFSDSPAENYASDAGQRYSLIESDITILYPSLGVSFRVLDNLSFGVTLQSAYANITNTLAMGTLGAMGEHTFYDAVIKLNFEDVFTPAAVLGVAYDPIPGLTLGASFRPRINFRGRGPLDLSFPEGNTLLESQVEVLTEDPTASLQMSFPAVLRAGAAYRWKKLNIAGEFLYERWSANEKFLVTPDIEISAMGEAQKLEPIEIPKNWKDSYGGRLGVSYEVLPVEPRKFSLEVFAGGIFETNAIPTEYQQIDFVTGDRLGGSLGATFGWDDWAITVSGMVYAPVSIDVTDSKLEREAAIPDTNPIIVGNGNYTANVWVASVGLAYRGLNLGR